MKVLLLAPQKDHRGGVANYCNVLVKEYQVDFTTVSRGSRKTEKKGIRSIPRLIGDYLNFFVTVLFGKITLAHQNTSLGKKGILRDSFYMWFAKLIGKKVVLFVHGWDWKHSGVIDNNPGDVFRKLYFKADSIIVLANEFKEKLVEWGYKGPVYVETTIVDKELLKGFSMEKKGLISSQEHQPVMLFLSRVIEEKGIFVTIDIFAALKKKYPSLKLVVAGDGRDLERAKAYAAKTGLPDIEFLGFIRGEQKLQALRDGDIFMFPTSHGEGMPTTILEAMAFGLAVVTADAGGTKDFFESGKMGYLIDPKNVDEYIQKTDGLLANKELLCEMATFNHDYAMERFISDKVTRRIEKVYFDTISKN